MIEIIGIGVIGLSMLIIIGIGLIAIKSTIESYLVKSSGFFTDFIQKETFNHNSEFLYYAINGISSDTVSRKQIEIKLWNIYTELLEGKYKNAVKLSYETFGKLYERIILTLIWFIDEDISLKKASLYYIGNSDAKLIEDIQEYIDQHPMTHSSE